MPLLLSLGAMLVTPLQLCQSDYRRRAGNGRRCKQQGKEGTALGRAGEEQKAQHKAHRDSSDTQYLQHQPALTTAALLQYHFLPFLVGTHEALCLSNILLSNLILLVS